MAEPTLYLFDGYNLLHAGSFADRDELVDTLASYVAAGLTPYQALEAATRNPAEFLGALKEWGTIEPGKRADLVLLAANPLEEITNTQRIEAVSLGGRWMPTR